MLVNSIVTGFKKKVGLFFYKKGLYLLENFRAIFTTLSSRTYGIFFLEKVFFIVGIVLLINIIFGSIVFAVDNETGCGDNANPGIKTICDIIMFLQGRIARAIVAFSIMLAAWSFVGGQFKWQEMLTLAIGIGIFYAPKTFALFLLPEYVEGITGDGYDIYTKYTPDEIITCACPNLR